MENVHVELSTHSYIQMERERDITTSKLVKAQETETDEMSIKGKVTLSSKKEKQKQKSY